MKNIISIIVLSLSLCSMVGQTIVNTSVENRKVILEEFTGIHCVFCPQGHEIAQAIKDANEGNVFLVNIHQGSFANPSNNEPDFRTPFGDAIAGQSGLTGYPAGTINRHRFPGQEQGNGTAMSRGQWGAGANEIMDESSYVNVAVEATLDVINSEIVIHVEAFYTGDSPENTNLLNIMLLQNNTLGPQTGGNMGSNYVHQHRLIDMITGQWGMTISNTNENSFIDETFTYTIPADYNGVPVVLADIEIVAFITETQQEVISGNGTHPTFFNLPLNNDANVQSIEEISDQCGLDFGPRVSVQNTGDNTLTTLDFEYSVNSGAPATYTWNGSIDSYQVEIIELPGIAYTLESNNSVEVSIANDDDNANNSAAASFGETDLTSTNYLTLLLNTDDNGDQTTWTVKNPSGVVIANGGPYDDNITINPPINLTEAGCHAFRLIDSGGNGSGSVVLYDSNSDVLYNSSGLYGAGVETSFISDGILGVNSNVLEQVSIYPNPASSILNIKNAESANIEVYDILGKLLLTKSNISFEEQINVSNFQVGTYFIKLSKENQVSTERFIVSK
jgi:hypothetical protein